MNGKGGGGEWRTWSKDIMAVRARDDVRGAMAGEYADTKATPPITMVLKKGITGSDAKQM